MQPSVAADSTFRRAIAGDREAFALLVRQNQAMVWSIAWHILHDQASAEELAQEVFLELYRNLAAMESADHVTNWLRRVATHRSIDYSRREAARPSVALDDVPEPPAAVTGSDPLLSEALRRLTATLPEKARAVVVLRFQEDLEPAEIAAVLEMPVNTVKSHLQRSLAALRKKLEKTQVRL
jgi:RNA polymerase sigma-70 factor (ECF subfamily)